MTADWRSNRRLIVRAGCSDREGAHCAARRLDRELASDALGGRSDKAQAESGQGCDPGTSCRRSFIARTGKRALTQRNRWAERGARTRNALGGCSDRAGSGARTGNALRGR